MSKRKQVVVGLIAIVLLLAAALTAAQQLNPPQRGGGATLNKIDDASQSFTMTRQGPYNVVIRIVDRATDKPLTCGRMILDTSRNPRLHPYSADSDGVVYATLPPGEYGAQFDCGTGGGYALDVFIGGIKVLQDGTAAYIYNVGDDRLGPKDHILTVYLDKTPLLPVVTTPAFGPQYEPTDSL